MKYLAIIFIALFIAVIAVFIAGGVTVIDTTTVNVYCRDVDVRLLGQ